MAFVTFCIWCLVSQELLIYKFCCNLQYQQPYLTESIMELMGMHYNHLDHFAFHPPCCFANLSLPICSRRMSVSVLRLFRRHIFWRVCALGCLFGFCADFGRQQSKNTVRDSDFIFLGHWSLFGASWEPRRVPLGSFLGASRALLDASRELLGALLGMS